MESTRREPTTSETDWVNLLTQLLTYEVQRVQTPRRNIRTFTAREPSNRARQPQRTTEVDSRRDTIHSILEIARGYNATIHTYNRNMDRIITLLENELYNRNHRNRISIEDPIIQRTPRFSSWRNRQDSIGSRMEEDVEEDIHTPENIPETDDALGLQGGSVLQREGVVQRGSVLQRESSDPNDANAESGARTGSMEDWYSRLLTNDYSYFINTYPLYRMADNTMPSENEVEGLTPEQIVQSTDEITFSIADSSLNGISNVCPISLEEFVEGETILQIRECRHVFKPAELRRWFERHNGCPVCRRNLRVPETQPSSNSDDEIPNLEIPERPAAAPLSDSGRRMLNRPNITRPQIYRNPPSTLSNSFGYVFEFPLFVSDVSGTNLPSTYAGYGANRMFL